MSGLIRKARLRADVEWRIVTPRGERLPYCGQIEAEAWAAIELSWGERRAELIRKGYECRPFGMVPVDAYRRRLDAQQDVAAQDINITVDVPAKARRKHFRPS